jgi:long-subunit fatty acid transport protein
MISRLVSCARIAVASVALLTCALPALAGDFAVAPLQEVPFTTPMFHGARAMGMGGVALAVADDGSALLTNPAGLARLRRVEVSAALSRRSDDLAGSVFGDDFETSLSTTKLSALRFAYPFPTFRGSLVLGLAAERVGDLNDDFYAVYEDEFDWKGTGTGPSLHTEDLRAEGDIYAWTVGGAFDASERLSLGAALSYWSGRMDHRYEKIVEDVEDVSAELESLAGRRDTEMDLSGVRLNLGALYYASETVTVGLLVESPISIATDTRIDGVDSEDGVDSVLATEYYAEDFRVPFTFAAGVAAQPTDFLLVGADVAFSDWTELERELELFAGEPGRRDDYTATTDVRVGAELTLPAWPVRLRAGYATRPIAYRGLDIDSDRSYFTLGAGFLIDTVLAIDVAWIRGSYERSVSSYEYEESVDDLAVLVEAAYRF